MRWLPMVAMAEVKGDDAAGRPALRRTRTTRTTTHEPSAAPPARRRSSRKGPSDGDRSRPSRRRRARPRSSSPSSTSAHDVLHAAEKVRDAGYSRCDAHTPFPVHGMDRAMGLKDSRLGWIVLACALTGLTGAFVMMHWMNGVDYPIDRRRQAAGAPGRCRRWCPIMFELTVLFSAFGAVLRACSRLNRLPRHHHPVFESERFRAASDDKFFISIEADDPKFDVDKTRDAPRGRARGPRRSDRGGGVVSRASPHRRSSALLRCARRGRPRRLPRADERRPADPARAQHVRPASATTRSRTRSSSPTTARCARPSRGRSRATATRTIPRSRPGLVAGQVRLRDDHPAAVVDPARGRHGEAARARPGALRHLLRAVPRADGRRQGHGRLQARQGRPTRASRAASAPLPSYEDPRIRHMPDGQLFATITHGVRTMPAYGAADSRRRPLGHRRLRPRARDEPDGRATLRRNRSRRSEHDRQKRRPTARRRRARLSHHRRSRPGPARGRSPAGVGALGLGIAAYGYTMDPERFAFSYLFAFFVAAEPRARQPVLRPRPVRHEGRAGASRSAAWPSSSCGRCRSSRSSSSRSSSRIAAALPVARRQARASAARRRRSTPSAARPSPLAEARGIAEHASPRRCATCRSPTSSGWRRPRSAPRGEIVDAQAPLPEPARSSSSASSLTCSSGPGSRSRYFRWSTDQDKTKALENTAAAQRFAPAGLMLFALTLTFFAFDWLLSLDADLVLDDLRRPDLRAVRALPDRDAHPR